MLFSDTSELSHAAQQVFCAVVPRGPRLRNWRSVRMQMLASQMLQAAIVRLVLIPGALLRLVS